MVSIENAIKRAKKETLETSQLSNKELYRAGDIKRRDLAKKIVKERGYIIGTYAEIKRLYGSRVFGLKMCPSLFLNSDVYIFSMRSQILLGKNSNKKEVNLIPEYRFEK